MTGSHQVSEYLNAACTREGASLPLARALRFLAEAEGHVTPSQLARELGRSPAATSEILKRLVRSEEINAEVDPIDRRSFRLTLTRSGRARWAKVRPALESAEAYLVRSYGKQRLAELAGAVEDLAASVEEGAD